ncbi:MAG: peptidoglycan editing factor PgeF, partial [bacterium]
NTDSNWSDLWQGIDRKDICKQLTVLETQIASLPIFLFSNLQKEEALTHFVTTRQGGVSPHPYDTLNLAFHTGECPENVIRNRHILAHALRLPPDTFVAAEQTHSANVAVVNEKNQTFKATDGLMTNKPGICLLVLVADCVPLIFFDPKKRVIGVAHAGWRGTAAKIAEKMVHTLHQEFKTNPEDILVGIGPAIGPCCYEVGADTLEHLRRSLGERKNLFICRDRRWFFDLKKANKSQLLDAGIRKENIEQSEICTSCHATRFFSFRNARGPTGRFAAGIMLNGREKET